MSTKTATTTIKLAETGQSAVFTQPKTNWDAIHGRVDAALSLKPIVDIVASTLPNIHALIAVCETWKASTFDALQYQAEAMGDTANLVITSYTLLQDLTDTLDPTAPLTPEQKAAAMGFFLPLSIAVNKRKEALDAVGVEIEAFLKENAITDARLIQIKDALGPEWSSIAPETGEVGRATQTLTGAWRAVAFDLHSVADGKVELTTPFMIGLALTEAIAAWQALGREAKDFLSVSNQHLSERRTALFRSAEPA